MALTVGKLQLFPLKMNPKTTTIVSSSSIPPFKLGRRTLGVFLSLAAATPQGDSRELLLQKYLKKSEENKAKNDKERRESYYKRNYKEYFESLEGSLKGKDQLSDTEKGILDWLQKNR